MRTDWANAQSLLELEWNRAGLYSNFNPNAISLGEKVKIVKTKLYYTI